jgi:FMN-dependent NADH-azoreductase
MKKLLYITVNSKPEHLSASKTVGRALINRFMEKYPEFKVEELDLYKEHIPRLEYEYFESRNCIVNEEAVSKLPEKEQKEVHKIVELCNQFIEADIYVIAAPMWSLSFPAPLKEYIDCIVQAQKTITFPEKGEKPKGLLNDKSRTAVYIQSSGGNIAWMMRPILDKGLDYIEDIMKFMGINQFERLLVDGTGTTEEEKYTAIEKAKAKIDGIIEKIDVKEIMLV